VATLCAQVLLKVEYHLERVLSGEPEDHQLDVCGERGLKQSDFGQCGPMALKWAIEPTTSIWTV
jgi:hypothetical protein